MKQNKLWLFVLLALALSSLAFASVPVDDVVAYYKLDETTGTSADNSEGTASYDGTATNSQIFTSNTGISGKINSGADFTQGNDKITTGYSQSTGAFTWASWVKPKSLHNGVIMGFRTVGTDQVSVGTRGGGTDDFVTTVAGSTALRQYVSTAKYTVDTWVHVVMTYDPTTGVTLYLDGVKDNGGSGTGSAGTWTAQDVVISGNSPSESYSDTFIDEVLIADTAFNASEVEDLYNAQKDGFESGQYPTFGDVANFTITAVDFFDSSTINTFNATINGTFYNTTTGNITTPFLLNETDILNITIQANNYFPYTNTTYNTSNGNLQAQLDPQTLTDFILLTPNNSITNQPTFNITWIEAVSPTNKTVTYNGTVEYTDNATIVDTFSTTDLFYNLNITTYLSENYTITINATESSTFASFEHSSTLRIDFPNYLYFFDEQTTNPLQNASVTIDLPNSVTDLDLTTDAEGKVQFNSYQNNILQTGNYSITFRDFTGFVTPITFDRTYNSLPINESFNISVTNINIQIYYRLNNLPFNETANVIIQGLGNFTTSNGSIFIQNGTISQGIYSVYVFADGYFNEQREITYTSQDSLNISFYMAELNQSNSGTVTIRAIDDFQRLIQNAKINLLEYQPQQLSYIVVSQCLTDSNGECKFLIETNTKTYKFTAEATNNGDIISAETNPQVFSDDVSGGQIVLFSEQTITITLSFIERYSLNPINNIIFNITESYNEITKRSQINTYWRTIDGTDITICLEYFQIVNSMKVSLTGSTFCSTSSEGQIIPPNGFTLNDTKTYVADVYIQNGRILLESYRYNSIFSFEQMLNNNATLPFVVLLLWIGIIAGGIMFRNIPLTGIGIIVFAWIIAYIFPSYAITSISVLQTLIGLGLIYNGRKKEDFQ